MTGPIPVLTEIRLSSIIESSDEELVRAISEVDRRDQQHRFPLLALIHDDRRECADRSRHHEAGAAPHEILAPR